MSDNTDLVFQYDSAYGGQYTLKPYLGMYADNNNLCVAFEYLDKDDGRWYPFCYATVNTIPLAYLEGTIDTNNNGLRFLDFLENNGFGKCSPHCVRSGFCVYPIFKFNEDLIRKIDPKVFAEYAKTFGKEFPALDDQILAAESIKQSSGQTKATERER